MLPCSEQLKLGKDRSKIRKAVWKLLLFKEKGPSYSQPAVIGIHRLDCANSDWSDEGLQLSYRYLKMGNASVEFKFVIFFLFCLYGRNCVHINLLKSHVKALTPKQWRGGGRGGIYCEVLVFDWLFLVDCSKAVQLLLDIIIAARKKWLIGWQICQILFVAK